jgi:hypothetical protein
MNYIYYCGAAFAFNAAIIGHIDTHPPPVVVVIVAIAAGCLLLSL